MPRPDARNIATALKKRIDKGEWREWGRMPPERELAGDFGVARNTVRRAIGLLQEGGAVTRHVGRGTFVVSREEEPLSAAITRIEGAGPADLMEVRQLLEPAAAAQAATFASVAELNAIREAYAIAVEARDMPRFEEWDAEFHHRIFLCSRNEFLKEIHNLTRILRNQAPWFEMKQRSFSEERRSAYCDEHEAILDALLRRDPDAAREAMRTHLRTVEKNLLGR